MEWKFKLTNEEFNKCDKFANDSSKTQRENRSGGTLKRNLSQIRDDTLRGKVGETILKNFLEQAPFNVEGISLDFEVYPRGIWDKVDINLNNRNISIKSSKWFSKWLLLESKDIERGDTYDYYILILIDRDLKSGVVKGFVDKDKIINRNEQTLLLKKGEFIPNTSTPLDADNHARHVDNLRNTEEDWKEFVKSL